MKFEIITAEEAYKLTEKKRGGVPPEVIDKALHEIDRVVKVVASYEGVYEYTFDVRDLFLTHTGVVFTEDDEHKAARKVAKTLRKAGYKVVFKHIGSFELDPDYFLYREGMTVSWRK